MQRDRSPRQSDQSVPRRTVYRACRGTLFALVARLMTRLFSRSVLAMVGLLLLHATGALAQSSASWRVAFGRDEAALRDIARCCKPVDASPVTWRGTGTTMLVEHVRLRGTRLQRVEFSVARAGNFVYDSGLEKISRPEGDRFTRLDARYEYRRYFFSDVIVRGLDVGAGISLGGSRSSMSRNMPDNLSATRTHLDVMTALVAAARFRRSRFGLEVNWGKGAHIARIGDTHSVSADSASRWGGGWLTDLSIGADVSVSERVSLTARFLTTGDALLSSHSQYAGDRSSLMVGVTYAK